MWQLMVCCFLKVFSAELPIPWELKNKSPFILQMDSACSYPVGGRQQSNLMVEVRLGPVQWAWSWNSGPQIWVRQERGNKMEITMQDWCRGDDSVLTPPSTRDQGVMCSHVHPGYSNLCRDNFSKMDSLMFAFKFNDFTSHPTYLFCFSGNI